MSATSGISYTPSSAIFVSSVKLRQCKTQLDGQPARLGSAPYPPSRGSQPSKSLEIIAIVNMQLGRNLNIIWFKYVRD